MLVFSSSVVAGYSVNINSASGAELADALDGVGQLRGQAIVEFRETYGDFQSAEALTQVKGIGVKTVERNRNYIIVVPVAAEAGK
ncbi:MAG: hypothetical protein GXP14_13545 [Gammaproteobacteria bacterium]|nr:hypothetical protein [Gammaproteobacteria bacterium]